MPVINQSMPAIVFPSSEMAPIVMNIMEAGLSFLPIHNVAKIPRTMKITLVMNINVDMPMKIVENCSICVTFISSSVIKVASNNCGVENAVYKSIAENKIEKTSKAFAIQARIRSLVRLINYFNCND